MNNLHLVPSLPLLIQRVVDFCSNNDLRNANALMQHLFLSTDPEEYFHVYANGVAVARIPMHHLLVINFHRKGVYKCLLNP